MNKLTPGIQRLSFEYHKNNGEITDRDVLQFDVQANGNILTIELPDMEDIDFIQNLAEDVSDARRAYLDSIYAIVEAYDGVQIKSFMPSKMKNVKNTTPSLLRDVE